MRMRLRALPILIAAPLISMLIAGCSSQGEGTSRPESSITCGTALATVVHRERTGDTAGVINSELDWLSHDCSAEYGVFVDYSSARAMAEQLGPDTCDSLAQHISREAIALLSEDGLCSGATGGSVPGGPGNETQPGGGIAWNDAVNHAGTTQRVCGPLAGTGTSDDDVFLDLGLNYPSPKRFQIVIWDIGAVKPIPLGATVCTSGQIALYNGVAQIELRSASPVEIYN